MIYAVSSSQAKQKSNLSLPSASVWSHWVLGIFVALVFAMGLALRLYDLTDPPLDFHPTRQLRMAMIARGIYFKMSPLADAEIRATAISFARSMGTFEPPVLESLVAYSYRLLGGEQIWISRVFTSLFWLIGGAALFDLSRRMTSLYAALAALLYYLFLPFSVIASRSFQPDPAMVMGIILSIYAFYRWLMTRTWGWAVMAGLASSLAVFVKVFAGYLVVGLALAVVIYVFGIKRALKEPQVWAMALLMAVPPLIYYGFILQGRSSDYFLNWTIALIPMVLHPAFYLRWLIQLGDLMGLTLLFLALIGVLISKPLNRAVLLGLWAGYGVYGLTVPYQITTHNYYNLPLVPIIAVSLAPVAGLLVDQLKIPKKVWRFTFTGAVIVFLAFAVWTSIYELDRQDFRTAPVKWEDIGTALPADGKIIALTQDYGYPLMYYGWRKVNLWPDQAEQDLAILRGKAEKDLQEEFSKRTKGFSYFLVTDFNQLDRQPLLREKLFNEYPVSSEGDGYVIFDLNQPLNAMR